jgi:hypothetical protein
VRGVYPLVFHRAPESFVERPAGARQGRRAFFAGPGMARRKIPAKDEERRASRRDETQGVLSFGSVFFAQAKKMNTQLPPGRK